jgi:hypothetical protein
VQHHYQPVEKVVKDTKINRTQQEKERVRIKRHTPEQKFLKFTSEGYVETRKDQDAGVVSWQ